MAVRMLTYSGLRYQRLVGEGVLRERGELPPVLPVVIYNGRSPWTRPSGGVPGDERPGASRRIHLYAESRRDGISLPRSA